MVWKHEVCETKWRPILKYNFLDSYLFCFVYKIFVVLYLRIRLFALLTAGKRNGTGVYAEISFPEFTHTHDPRPTTHDPRPTTHDI